MAARNLLKVGRDGRMMSVGWAQTTVQWLERLHCVTLLEASTLRERALVSGCPVLNAAIDDAVLSGVLAVPIDSSRE